MFNDFNNTAIDLASDPFFSRVKAGEKHPYQVMSVEERKAWKEKYLTDHQEPYHATVLEVEKLCRNALGGTSPFSSEGMTKILNNETLTSNYIELISDRLFKSEESWKKAYVNTLKNSFENVRIDPTGAMEFPYYSKYYMSAEGAGAMATYQNRDNFSGMLAFGIGGWFGRSKMLELYLPIEDNNKPEWSFSYILEYALHPVTGERMPLPQAWRNEQLYQIFDLPNVKPIYIDESQTPHIWDPNTNIQVLDKENSKDGVNKYKTGVLGEGWLKIGADTNLILDSADDTNNFSEVDALEPTVTIEEILYISTYTDPTGTKTPVYKKYRCDIVCQEANGQQNILHFNGLLKFKNIGYIENDELKTKELHSEKIFGEVNIDTGDFIALSSVVKDSSRKMKSIIVGVKVYAKISDVANQRSGLEHETERHRYTYRLEYTNFGHIPITPYVLDNWNLGNDSLAYVATMTDFMTKSYSITRDLKAERHLMDDFEKPEESFPLYLKLGGFYKSFTHDFALTGPVLGEDPYKQSRFALRDRLFRGISDAETRMYIPQNVARQWILFGPERQVQAFAEIANYNMNPGANDQKPVNASGTRFGFNIDEAGSIIDSLGRNIKIIGCTDQRWMDRNIIGGMRSSDMKYPTFLYYAYMFRIFTGIDQKYRNLSAVLFWGRDGIFTMVKAHIEVILTNCGDDLYEKTIASARERTIISGDRG